MRRISKQNRSRAGFTFTELILVVGILIILACVLVYGINRLIKLAENSNSAVVNTSLRLSGLKVKAAQNSGTYVRAFVAVLIDNVSTSSA